MKTFVQLSPSAQAILLHLREANVRAGEEIPVTMIVSAMALRKGVRIRDCVRGVDECVTAQWLEKLSSVKPAPDRIALTTDGAGMLLYLP